MTTGKRLGATPAERHPLPENYIVIMVFGK